MQVQLTQMIQRHWGRQVYAIRDKRKAIVADTNKGLLYVKSYSSKEKADWVVSLSRQLLQKGFSETLRYYDTKEGRSVVPFNGSYFVAIRPIMGRDAKYDDVYDVMRTVHCLGEYHRHAKGIEGGPSLETKAAPIIEKWENRLERFLLVTQKLQSSRSVGNLEKRIIRISPYILAEARAALDMARRSPIVEEYQAALASRAVAHRDLASHNFLIGDKTFLIDYDTAMYDTPLIDLIQMIDRTLDQQKWQFDCFYRMMEQYQLSVPLTEQQYALVYLLLRYPDNFMREVIGLYEGKRRFVSKKIDAYLTMIIKQWSQRMNFFRGSQHFLYEEQQSESTIVV
ncbi:hypothetical protein BEP19_05670 [Ammoniphilus oxalaticus]|uniref:Aminoglycoside phosphotransferase domain-containing protein n=1 Tax=Ammoniphilus oxalaticus TaxID=66863 RepID=A0A419SIV1_9BACL|nr:phosphotransferase [Ammoniphilus oxalaticus]RKD23915.1 hypothetical protein BEP19_05670 [Ammoniphilus oxalaticus]